MQTTLTDIATRDSLPMLNAYKYDQLNRLLEARSYTDGLSSNIWNPTTYDDKYFNTFTYDANGNILTQKRHNSAGTMLDDLTYHYQLDDFGNLVRNRLYNVNDAAGFQNAGDLTNQGTFVGAANQINLNNNYVYDEEGRLIKDVAEGIELIVWRVDGKVKEIHRHEDFEELKNLSFDYDAFGRRIAKHVYDNLWNLEKSTYYILDAQGNQLSVYEHVPESEIPYELTERVIYGSARIGSQVQKIDLLDTEPEELLSLTLGEKHYFMSNHLGNILTVINDIKVPYLVGTDVAYYATIVSTADYSPFGVQLDVRTTENQAKWGFQGQETDNEIKGEGNSVNYTYRMHDPRLGRFFAVDPMHHIYSYNSPYAFSENRVIDAIELEGLETFRIIDLKNGFYKLTYIKHSETLVVYDEFNNIVDQSMGTNFKYKDLQYQMRGFSYICRGGRCELDIPHRGENYKTPGPAQITTYDLASYKTHFTDMSSFSVVFTDITKNKTKHVQGIFNIDRRNFTAVNGVVSQNYAAPQSSTMVQATVTVEYALHLADKTSVHSGMAVSVVDASGNVLASGLGGETLNFQVPSNTTFTVVVNYSGAANPQIQSNIAVTTQTTVEVIDNDDDSE